MYGINPKLMKLHIQLALSYLTSDKIKTAVTDY